MIEIMSGAVLVVACVIYYFVGLWVGKITK